MNSSFIGRVVSSLALLVFDVLWVTQIMGPLYKNMILDIQGKVMKVNRFAACAAYVLMVVGLNMFVISNTKEESLLTLTVRGFLFGIVLYGVYDCTAAAVFQDWNWKLAALDILWGGVAFAAASAAFVFATSKL